ncbi:hypothetical protein [Mycolicibacterium neoaurum]|uniref:Uncharacterized protein n=1 Tax=Mycolicibacterium neoaurum VKM Ac-1815D TaxID=700508 RepID=V5XIN8_MYCNE
MALTDRRELAAAHRHSQSGDDSDILDDGDGSPPRRPVTGV